MSPRAVERAGSAAQSTGVASVTRRSTAVSSQRHRGRRQTPVTAQTKSLDKQLKRIARQQATRDRCMKKLQLLGTIEPIPSIINSAQNFRFRSDFSYADYDIFFVKSERGMIQQWQIHGFVTVPTDTIVSPLRLHARSAKTGIQSSSSNLSTAVQQEITQLRQSLSEISGRLDRLSAAK